MFGRGKAQQVCATYLAMVNLLPRVAANWRRVHGKPWLEGFCDRVSVREFLDGLEDSLQQVFVGFVLCAGECVHLRTIESTSFAYDRPPSGRRRCCSAVRVHYDRAFIQRGVPCGFRGL
jgi:hypothetical protein